MRRRIPLEEFQESWEKIIPTATNEQLKNWKENTSPHHPSENMVWLYDRLTFEQFQRELHDMESNTRA